MEPGELCYLPSEQRKLGVMSKEYLKELLEFKRGLGGGFQVKQEILGALIIIQDGQVCCLITGTERKT